MIKTKAIVLLRKEYNDYDCLVTFYTLDFGKISLVARGLKRGTSKLAGHLEPLNFVDLMIIKGRNKDYVGSAISDNSFLNIKNDYDRVTLAGEAIRFLQDLIFPNLADFNIFLTLKDFLINLNEKEQDYATSENLLLFFKIKILSFLGYDFADSKCSKCGKDNPGFFDFFNKDFICLACSGQKANFSKDTIRIGQGSLNIKKQVFSSEILEFSNLDISQKDKQELNNFIETIKKII